MPMAIYKLFWICTKIILHVCCSKDFFYLLLQLFSIGIKQPIENILNNEKLILQ